MRTAVRVVLGVGCLDFERGRDSSRLVCCEALGERIDFFSTFFFKVPGLQGKKAAFQSILYRLSCDE